MEDAVTLLLVEDEPLLQNIMVAGLEDAGFRVVTAADGATASKSFHANADEIAALITDVRLGAGLDGWEVARRARQMRPELPVVYMTGDSAADWAAKGVPKSVLLQKPFAIQQAVIAVATLLNEASSTITHNS
ncbi:response regulator [Sphingobium sp. AR-3-1]|uniref:Response regulator n=1 Tax=Sphingobium psychrophilum TaxID=2728834 RepID=A0A7X9X0Q1_9SPHN|nr:response regulator [Sphingobium psychrophilum]NML13295.1 response regulator [Sphingobium psychrophilum]